MQLCFVLLKPNNVLSSNPSSIYHIDTDIDNLEELDDDNLVHDIEQPSDNSSSSDLTSSSDHSKLLLDSTSAMNETPFIGYKSSVLDLAQTNVPLKCQKCNSQVSISSQFVGTCIMLKWVIIYDHSDVANYF